MRECLTMDYQMGLIDSRFSLKGTGATYAPDRTFDTEHIRLELDIDINREKIRGRCKTILRALTDKADIMEFDAVQFKIKSVKWNGHPTSYTYQNNKIQIQRKKPVSDGATVTVDIEYEVVKPKLGLYFIKPNKFYPHRPTQVWTQGEDEYARYWFPCHDAPHERTTTEVIATVPKGFIAVSNGELVKSSGQTFHYRQAIPHATYLVTLTVGQFSLIGETWKNIPVQYYCEKDVKKTRNARLGKRRR